MTLIKDTNLGYYQKEPVIEQAAKEADLTAKPSSFTFIRMNNLYMLFWIFIVGSIFGCYMEQIQYYFIKGIWESRAGVIWGPFSEIYGCGAVLMYLILQKMKDKHPMMIFTTAMIWGSAFEYLAALFQEIFFKSETWDYSDKALNIGGKTSLEYSVYWGLLGLLFSKWIFPKLTHTLMKLKGWLSFTVTWAFILFMSIDLIFSALAVNRWDERIQGAKPSGTIEKFLDNNYGNDRMDEIYPHMDFIAVKK